MKKKISSDFRVLSGIDLTSFIIVEPRSDEFAIICQNHGGQTTE